MFSLPARGADSEGLTVPSARWATGVLLVVTRLPLVAYRSADPTVADQGGRPWFFLAKRGGPLS